MNRFIIIFLLLFAIPCIVSGNNRRDNYKPRRNAVLHHVSGGSMIGLAMFRGGIEYEHYLSNEGNLSFTVSFAGFTRGGIMPANVRDRQTQTSLNGGYLAPGIRLHPACNKERLDVGLGISLPFGQTHREEFQRSYSSGNIEKKQDRFFGAVLGELSINFRTTRSPVFGLFLNAGFCYTNTNPILDQSNSSSPFIFLLGIKFGGQL